MGDRALAVTEIIAEAGVFYDYEFEICRWRIAPYHSRRACIRTIYAPCTGRRARRASRAGLPRRNSRGFSLRRHCGRTGAARAAGDEHATRPDADFAVARAGGACGHEFPAALRVDGGERGMPRVARSPRNSVNDRPAPVEAVAAAAAAAAASGWLGPSGGGGQCSGYCGAFRGAGRRARHTARRLGGATAFPACVCTDIVVEGRANTPEPLLRAALGVQHGRPDPRLLGDQARKRIEQLSWVEHATVERQLPGTVVVRLTRAPSVRDLAEPGQVRADRPRWATRHQSERCRLPSASACRRAWCARGRSHADRRAERPAGIAETSDRRSARRRAAVEPAHQQRHGRIAARRARDRRRSTGCCNCNTARAA